MAATVILDMTLVDTADTTTGWAGSSGQQDLEVKVQGTASYTYQTPKNGSTTCTFTPAANIDMSGSDNHLYWWMRCDVMPFCEPKNTGTTNPSGMMLRLTDGTGNFIQWHIAGSDTWRGEWRSFILDINDTTSDEIYSQSGTLDLTDIDIIGFVTDNSNSGNIRIIDNTWVDVVRFGKGLIVTGTSFNIDDIEAIDQNSSNMYGIIEKIDGVYFVQGQLTIGDGTNTAELNSENETIAFRDRNVSSGLYNLTFSGSNTSVTANTMSILSSGDNENTRPGLDVDTSVTAFTMDGSAINRGDFIVFNDSCSVTNSKFNDCNTVTPALSVFQSNSISNSNHIRACEMDQEMSGASAGNFASNSFLNNFSAATWYAFGGTYADYSNHYDGNLYDIENSSSDALTINLDGTSNASSTYENPGTVTLVSTTNYSLTNLAYYSDDPTSGATEVRIYTSGSTDDYTTIGHEIYGVEDITGGTTTYQYGQDVVTSGYNCIVMIHNVYYETVRYMVDLLGTDTTQQIQQQFDRNYSNP